jgi:hypothetical protein
MCPAGKIMLPGLIQVAAGSGFYSMDYSGSSKFAVWLKDSQGENIDLLANTVGSYNNKKSESPGPGKYCIDVTAGGPWTIRFTSP